MNLTIHGHEDRYAVEQLLMSLFSQENITVISRLSRGTKWLTATTKIVYNGKTTHCARRLKARDETVRLRRQILQQSVYLAAEPGDYVVTARQAKDSGQWFVGGVTDENAREMTICFDFLEPGRKYVATVYSDAPDADGVNNTTETGSESCARYKIEQKKVTSKTKMKIRMAPSGGFAISIK